MGCKNSKFALNAHTGSSNPIRRPSEVQLDLEDFSISETTKHNLIQAGGLLVCKNKADAVYDDKMSQRLLETEMYASVGTEVAPRQPGPTMTVEQLRKKAGDIKPEFDRIVRGVVEKVGLDPDRELCAEKLGTDKSVLVPFTTPVLTTADLKGEQRCREKTDNEYDGDANRLCDVGRSSIVCETEEQIVGVIDGLRKDCEIVRMKNRFANPLFTGIRDLLINLKVGDHVFEIQVHLLGLVALKGEAHDYYNYFRDYFVGTDASYKKRMEIFEVLGETVWGEEGDIEGGILEILKGEDDVKLKALQDMTGKEMMADYDLNLTVTKRRHILVMSGGGSGGTEEFDGLLNMGITFAEKGDHDKALIYFERALKGYESVLGKDHPDTLMTVNNMGEFNK
jgi:hypothetical protein